MRHFIVIAGALAAFALSTSVASAQEKGFSLSSPLPAPSDALEIKFGTGYTQGFGRVSPARTLPDVGGAGIGAGLDIDYRTSPAWSVGVETQYQELTNGLNTSSRGLVSNLGATYHFAPAQVGDPFFRLGTGYRLLWDVNPRGTTDVTVLRHGFELASAKIGYDIRASEDLAIAPIIGADVNMFLWEKTTNLAGVALSSPEVATFVYAGLQGRFDVGGKRTGTTPYTPAPEPVMPTAAEIPAPPAPPPPVTTTPVAPSIAVSPDILKECQLKLGSVEKAPKFEFDKSMLLPADHEVLSQIAACFTTGPMKGMRLELVGRADPRGTVAYNDALGLRRASAVEAFLESAGMESSMMQVSSRGERDAVGYDESTWAIDRRVDVLSR